MLELLTGWGRAVAGPNPVTLQMISGLSNQYLYVEDDPTNAMDRSGLDCSTEEGEVAEEVGRERRGELSARVNRTTRSACLAANTVASHTHRQVRGQA